MSGKAIKGITIELGGDSTKLDKALEGPKKHARDLQNELKQVDKLLKLDPTNTELLTQKQKLLKEAIGATKEKLEILKEAEKQAQEQFKRGEISEEQYRALQQEIIRTEQELQKLEADAAKSNVTLAQVAEVADKIGDGAISAGKKFLPLTTAIAGAAGASVKFGSDFNDSMAKASTLVDTSIYDMDDLKDKILEVSNKTGVAAEQLGESMYNALSASVPMGEAGADMMAFLESNTRLARVGFTDIDTAVTATAKTLNAYGKDVSETDQVHRVLLQTQNLGIATVNELGEHLAKVTPTAAAMSVSFEQVGAALSVMTAKGTPAAQATTQLNALITELGKEGTKSSTILREKTGQSFKELMESGYTLTDVLALMQGELGGSTSAVMDLMGEVDAATGKTKTYEEACAQLGISVEEADQELIDMFGSVQAGKTALALGGENAAWFTENLAAMSDETDIVGESFEKMETDSYKMEVALNQLKNSGITLGQTLLNMLQPAIQKVSDIVKQASEWFSGLSDKQKQMIITIAGVVAAIGPALIAFGKVSKGVSSIISVGQKVGPLLSGIKTGASALFKTIMANPVVLVIAAIVAAVVLLYTKCEWFRDMVNNAFASIKTAISSAIEAAKPAIDSLVRAFKGLWDAAQPILQKLGEAFKKIVDALRPVVEFIVNTVMAHIKALISTFSQIIAAVQNVVSFVTNILKAFTALFKGDFSGFVDYLKSALQNVFDFFKNIFSAIFTYVINFFSNMGVDVMAFFSGLWEKIVGVFQGVGQWFTDRFTEAYDGVVGVFQAIGEWFASRWQDIQNALSMVATWFLTMFQNAYNNVTRVFQAIGQWFSARWQDIKNALAAVATWFMTMFQNAYNNVVQAFSGIGAWFGARWQDIKNAFSSVVSFFSTTFTNAWNAIVSAFSSVGSFFGNLWNDIVTRFTDIGVKIGEAVGGAFKAIVNGVLSTAENIVNGFFGMINGAIDVINAIPGVNISKVSLLSFPRLARGGVLHEGQAIMAEAGPELVTVSNGRAIVTPLTRGAKNTAVEAAGDQGGGGLHVENKFYTNKALDAYEAARLSKRAMRTTVRQLNKGRA